MDKIHNISNITVTDGILRMIVDGRMHRVVLSDHSPLLARATRTQQEYVVASPSGYGLHWPYIDEDLSIDGLIADG